MKLSEKEEQIYKLKMSGMTYNEVAKRINNHPTTVRHLFQKVVWVKQKEKDIEIARLNISPTTFRRLYNTACQYRQSLFLFHMNLLTIDGVAKAINENKIKPFNKRLSRGLITDKMVDELIIALEEKGYEMNHNYSRMSNTHDIGIHLISDMICNHSERIIKFSILDFEGILTCQSDGTEPKVYLSKPSRYNHKTISDQVINLMKEEGYIL